MPQNNPGSLSPDDYASLIAYTCSRADFNQGKATCRRIRRPWRSYESPLLEMSRVPAMRKRAFRTRRTRRSPTQSLMARERHVSYHGLR